MKFSNEADPDNGHDNSVYFHFIGVSNQNAVFPFIETLGQAFNNVGFTPVNHVRQWVQKDDEAINNALISKDLIQWLQRY